MGSSFTSYRGKGFWARDGQVQVWLYFLVEEIERLESPPAWLQQVKQDWLVQSTLGIGGCVCAGLDEVATSTERTQTLIELAQKALRHLHERGPRLTLEVPFSYATDGPDVLCIDRDIRIFSCVGEAFIDLLQGRVRTDASTS